MWITLPQADWIGQEVFLRTSKLLSTFYGVKHKQTKPKAAGYCTYREQDACAPTKGEEVEGAELAGLIELAVFGFGEVLLPVDFLQR